MHFTRFQLKSFLTYWLDAVDEHALHSPFMFDFYTNVLKGRRPRMEADTLSEVRKQFRNDHRIVQVKDFGAGSLHTKGPDRKLSEIARSSTTPEKFSRFYSRLLRHYDFSQVLELGTSVGINTMYLATAREGIHVSTFEGSTALADVARSAFRNAGAGNIELIEGNIDQTLPAYLSLTDRIDFAFVDANHRLEPTLRYVDQLSKKIHPDSIIIIDDIHYSEEMQTAWQTIQTRADVSSTIDLYRCGLIFFNPSLTKQNVVLQF